MIHKPNNALDDYAYYANDAAERLGSRVRGAWHEFLEKDALDRWDVTTASGGSVSLISGEGFGAARLQPTTASGGRALIRTLATGAVHLGPPTASSKWYMVLRLRLPNVPDANSRITIGVKQATSSSFAGLSLLGGVSSAFWHLGTVNSSLVRIDTILTTLAGDGLQNSAGVMSEVKIWGDGSTFHAEADGVYLGSAGAPSDLTGGAMMFAIDTDPVSTTSDDIIVIDSIGLYGV